MEASQPTAWPIAWRRKKVFYLETARARLRSPIIDANGSTVTVWRCPLIGEDRKWPAEGQDDANDPFETSATPKHISVKRPPRLPSAEFGRL